MDWHSDDIFWHLALISSASCGVAAMEEEEQDADDQQQQQLAWTFTQATTIQRGILCSVTLSTTTTWFLQILKIVKTSLFYLLPF